jgi:hypothetical protein
MPPQLLLECRRWLKEIVGFVDFDSSRPLDRTVMTFCTMLRRAHDHRVNGRSDEAGLHFVIALDLVFGIEGRSTESVADSAAVITHRPLGRRFEEQVRRIKKLYDARSKYVHEGRPFPAEDIIEAEQVASQALWALLAVSGAQKLSSTEEWLRKVNYVAAALRDERAIADDEFAVLGVTETEARNSPPNRISENVDAGAGTA